MKLRTNTNKNAAAFGPKADALNVRYGGIADVGSLAADYGNDLSLRIL